MFEDHIDQKKKKKQKKETEMNGFSVTGGELFRGIRPTPSDRGAKRMDPEARLLDLRRRLDAQSFRQTPRPKSTAATP